MYKQKLLSKNLIKISILIVIATLTYLLGFKLLFVPILLGISAWRLPMPKLFRSWFSRIVLSLIIMLAIVQVAAIAQFLMFPKSGFDTLAVLTLLTYIF